MSGTEPPDMTTSMGRAVLHKIGTFSEPNGGLITERLREGRMSTARGGGHATGEVSDGSRKTTKGKLEPDPNYSPLASTICPST